ncbi:MAG TPA: prepilin-type N-terminal cleavage/methylation domain-containing protein [Gemmatimonadaceae bacterium]
MKASRVRPIGNTRRGFTIIELIVSFVIGLVVLGSVVQMMIVQGKSYRKQREQVDVRETVREAAALLSWDLRQAAVAGSPFAVLGANTVTVRSPRGLGTICGKHALLPRYALWKTAGSIQATVDDTALVYQIGKGGWNKLKITNVGTPAAMGVNACVWPGARAPDLVVEFAVTAVTDTSNIKTGAPFRNFRRVEYAEFQQNGRWWLGRKVGNAAGYEQLTGPLLAPGANGLSFTYYDTLGAVSANTNAIGSVAFTIRTESFKNATTGSSFVYQRDSLTTKVAVRR